jgi:hypothetical protein
LPDTLEQVGNLLAELDRERADRLVQGRALMLSPAPGTPAGH